MKQPVPGTVQPMLAKTSSKPFTSAGWIFEPKLDGVRALAFVNGNDVTLLSRRNLDLTDRYRDISNSLKTQKHELLLDGEVTALDERGRPSFQLLQRAGQTAGTRIIYYVFDILFADGKSVMTLPLKERLVLLKKLVKQNERVKLVNDLGSDGIKAYEICVEHELEGIIAKRIDSVYNPGQRSGDWLKVKSFKSSEFLICGYSAGSGKRDDSFGSLILGYYSDNGELMFAGAVGTGFNQKLLSDLLKKMKPLVLKNSPFKKKLSGKSDITWVAPKLVAEIKFTEWTNDQILRIPVFLRLRDDVPPEQVRGK